MPASSPGGLPVPTLGDDPNVPRDMTSLATSVDTITVPRFTTTALRNAAFPTPVKGQQTNVAGTVQMWSGTAWVPTGLINGGVFGAPMAGSAATASASPIIMEFIYTTIQTNVSGDITINFPKAFPNGLIDAQMYPTDVSGRPANICTPIDGLGSVTYASFRCWNSSGAPLVNTIMAVRIILFGW